MTNLQPEIDAILQDIDSQISSTLQSDENTMKFAAIKSTVQKDVKSLDELLKNIDKIFNDESSI